MEPNLNTGGVSYKEGVGVELQQNCLKRSGYDSGVLCRDAPLAGRPVPIYGGSLEKCGVVCIDLGVRGAGGGPI